MKVEFRVFDGLLRSPAKVFAEAAAFATAIGPERLISISHSDGTHAVTVWYWSE